MSPIKEFLITLRNYCRSCVDYPFYKLQRPIRTESIRKILLIRQDCLGDIIVTMPTFEAFASAFPDAERHLLVAPHNASLIADYPFVDKVLSNPNDVDSDYDLAVNFLPKYAANKVLSRVRSRYKVGYAGRGGAWWLTNAVWEDRRSRPLHEIERNLELFRLVCPNGNASPEINFPLSEQEEREQAELLDAHNLKKHGYVVIHPGASRYYLRWPASHYLRFAEMLAGETFLKLVFTYGHGDDEVIDVIRSGSPPNSIFYKITDLRALKMLYAGAVVYVGNVTGPMHIAVSQQTPVVAMSVMKNNVDDMRYWGPRGPYDAVLYPDVEFDCIDFGDEEHIRYLLSHIREDRVLRVVLDILAQIRGARAAQ